MPTVSRGILRLIETAQIPLRWESVRAGQVIARTGDPLDALFVPHDSIILIARHTALDPIPLAVGMIGYEGLIGWAALLATDRWTHDAIAVCPGEIARIERSDMLAACASNAALNTTLLRVAHNHTLQLAQSVVANLGHSVERRLARWLLMLDDRTTGDAVGVTHAQLGEILNVRRASVTDAVHMLEGEALIVSSRGKFLVRDRLGLEARAGQSYGLSEDNYAENIEPFGRRGCVANSNYA